MQWMKRFWDTNYPGHPYDPVARRRGQPTDTPATLAPLGAARTTNTPGLGGRSGGKTPIGGHRAGSAGGGNHEQVLALQAQLKEMSTHLEGLEKERDFYFAKVCILPYRRARIAFLCFTHACPLIAARYRDPRAAADGRARKGKPRRCDAGRDSEDIVFDRSTQSITSSHSIVCPQYTTGWL